MLSRLKKKYWGEEVFSKSVASSKKTSVYVWNRDGDLTLNIRSERFSYIQGPGRNDATLTFEPLEVGSLMDAIASARAKLEELTKGRGST